MDCKGNGMDTQGQRKKPRKTKAKVERRVTQKLLKIGEESDDVVQDKEGGHFPERMTTATVRQ